MIILKNKGTGVSLFLVLALALALALLAGCSKINQDNYDKLEVGMTFGKVTDILGRTNKCAEQLGTRTCTWGDEQKYIRVSFVADKLVLYNSGGLESKTK